MNGTLVQLNGDIAQLEKLRQAVALPQLTIEHNPEFGYVLRSSLFEDHHVIEDIRAIAASLVTALNGAARLAAGYSVAVVASHVIIIDATGHAEHKKAFAEYVIMSDEFVFKTTNGDGTETIRTPFDPIKSWLEVSMGDASVNRVLQFLAQPVLDWRALYSLLEAITETYREDRIVTSQWATGAELRLFKQTSNNSNVLGIEARHTNSSWTAPSEPMDYAEARALIEKIAVNWLKFKVQEQVLQAGD